MAARRGSTRSITRLAAAVVLIASGSALAQQPQPPGPAPVPLTLPLPGLPSGGPGIPDAPPAPVPIPPANLPVAQAQPLAVPAPTRFTFKIEPNTPVKDLLPAPPKTTAPAGPVLSDDPAKVPEVQFQARPEKITNDGKLTEQAAHQLAKISHMNAKKTDAFMTALLENRSDLAGLPFAMGDDCRTSGERTKQFTMAVNTVRQFLNPGNHEAFWTNFMATCNQQDSGLGRNKELAEHVTRGRIAALMQMLAAESPEYRLGLVKYLTAVPHVEATKALARMAIFSAEEDVRLAAVDSLKVRREKDYTDILVKGLRYPWPAVAKRSADAIARMGRTDLIPELVAVLEESDPRMPTTKEVGGRKVTVVREMVKVNHHRNCMMCHAPAAPGQTGTELILPIGNGVTPAGVPNFNPTGPVPTAIVSGNMLTVEVPVEGQPLPLPSQGYRQSSPDLMIRVDVTYLRQDFSMQIAVGDAHPWPELQRFDFLVRERTLTAAEAKTFCEKLTPKEEGVLSPYHRAALAALREVTGKDTAPTAEAWRKLLDTSSKSPRPATP